MSVSPYGMPVCSTAPYNALCTGCHVPMCAGTTSTWSIPCTTHHIGPMPHPQQQNIPVNPQLQNAPIPPPGHPAHIAAVAVAAAHNRHPSTLHHHHHHHSVTPQAYPHQMTAPPQGFVSVPPPVIHRNVSTKTEYRIRLCLYSIFQ